MFGLFSPRTAQQIGLREASGRLPGGLREVIHIINIIIIHTIITNIIIIIRRTVSAHRVFNSVDANLALFASSTEHTTATGKRFKSLVGEKKRTMIS